MKTKAFIISLIIFHFGMMARAQTSDNQNVILPWGSETQWQMKYFFKDHIDDVPPPADNAGNPWYAIGYDDSDWETLTGPIGSNYYDINQGYDWNIDQSSFYLRGSFVLSEISNDYYIFKALVDDVATIYINGVKVMKGYTDGNYDDSNFSVISKDLLRIGENTLAVYVSDDGGFARCFDFTLYTSDSRPIIYTYLDNQGVIYHFNDETETYTVTGHENDFNVNLVIPTTICGYPVTKIGEEALAWCELESIVLPEGIETLENYALAGCNLKSIIIPASVTNMHLNGGNPISDNAELKYIQVAEGNTVYDSRDNCNAVIETATNTLIAGCKKTIIPQSVTSIGGEAFSGSRITFIAIPESVNNIGGYAFSYCENLKKVFVAFSHPIEIDEDAFPDRSEHILYVPIGSKTAFMAAEVWKDFQQIIEIDEEEVTAFRPYVVISDDDYTLTFCYDGEYMYRDGSVYGLEEVNGEPEWYGEWFQNVVFEPSFANVRPEQTHSWLREMYFGTVEGMRYLNTSETISADAMFYYANFLTSIDLRNFNTSNMLWFGHMFEGCGYLETLDLSTFDMSKARETHYMLADCNNLRVLKVSASMSGIDNNACEGVGSPDRPCVLYVPEGFDFGGIDTSGDCFVWKSGYFTLGDEGDNDVVVIDNNTFSALTFEGVRMVFKIIDPVAKTVQVGDGTVSIDPNTWGCVTIPSEVNGYKVVGIGPNGFHGCAPNLLEVLLPEGLEFIGENAFNASSINSIQIPETVYNIGKNAFNGCPITGIDIPEGVTSIGNDAFSGCYRLKVVNCYNPTPPTCGSDVFSSVPVDECRLYVPDGSEWTYSTTSPWSGFSTIRPFVTSSSTNSSIITDEEWAILCTIREELVANGWTTPWDMSKGKSSAASLKGVTLANEHVVKLDLSRNHLTGGVITSMLQLPFLRALDLSNNNLMGDVASYFPGAMEAQLPAAASLKSIDLSHNQLTGDIDLVASRLPALESINLSHNQLTGNIGLFASRFTSLELLDASYNHLTEVNPTISNKVANLNLTNQTLDTTLHFSLPQMALNEEIPSILIYDHALQQHLDDYTLKCNAGNCTFLLEYKDGSHSISLTSYNATYRTAKGDTLVVTSQTGDAVNSTLGMVLDFDDGDANFDGMVDVLDLQTVINYILKDYKKLFNFTASNLWEDSIINLQDLVRLVDVLLDLDHASGAPTHALGTNMGEPAAQVFVADGRLHLCSTIPVAALDIHVGDCTAASGFEAFFASHGFDYQARILSDGLHLVAWSFGDTLPEGDLVLCDVEGDNPAPIYARLADSEAESIDVTCGGNATRQTSLPLAGQRYSILTLDGLNMTGETTEDFKQVARRLRPGVYIIKVYLANGSINTRKITIEAH